MTFAEQLRSQRQRLGLTQSQAAELLEVSASWVDKAEREQRFPLKITQEGAIARLSKAKKYPCWVCLSCGANYGRSIHDRPRCWHVGTCDVCGIEACVTQPRDFGHLHDGWQSHSANAPALAQSGGEKTCDL
jgi:DNA-binding XRE family transcriptional regulator